MSERCTVPHEDWACDTCPECGEDVDSYGNTENDFRHCCYPDCGCDGARLCMAGEASERAQRTNVEGMWHRKGSERVSDADSRTVGQVRMQLVEMVRDDGNGGGE